MGLVTVFTGSNRACLRKAITALYNIQLTFKKSLNLLSSLSMSGQGNLLGRNQSLAENEMG
jgi:hypothetical protein